LSFILEISKHITKYYNAEENIRQEILLQSKLRHENILKLHEFFEDDINIYIILEYCSKGNFFQYLSVKRVLSESEAYSFFSQILKGLEYLHSLNIVHRDIKVPALLIIIRTLPKPENILLDSDYKVKICDFNWAIKLQKGYAADPVLCGTTEYMPPEVVLNHPHSYAVDVWSLGILLYVLAKIPMWLGMPPWRRPI
jgi:serine/threonine protein kinase